MQGLNQFLSFSCKAFLEAKTLSVVLCGPLSDYSTKQIIGSKITAVITQDNTSYKPKSDGTVISNLYEKVAIKVPGKNLNIAPGTVIGVINPVGTVYGEFRNQLSITAEDVKVAQPAKA